MDRRSFLAGLAAVGATPTAVRSQALKRIPSVGFVGFSSLEADASYLVPFRQGLAALGHQEGRTIAIEVRHSHGDVARGHELIAELASRPVDVFLSPGPAASRAIARRTKIPVVAIALPGTNSEPELFTSFARPGGTVTGFSAFGEEMSAKRIEMLKEILPDVKTLGVIHNATDPTFRAWGEQTLADIKRQGLEPVQIALDSPSEAVVVNEIGKMRNHSSPALIAIRDFMTSTLLKPICGAALDARIPLAGEHSAFAREGALFSYGADILDLFRRSASYVDRIIKGDSPADLPIQLPTTFELSVNLKTARALGVTIPSSIIVRANDVVE